MAGERFEAAIRNAIAKRRAEAPEQRQQIYQAARASFQRLARGAEDAAALDSAIAKIEASFADNSVQLEKAQKRRHLASAAFLLLAGIAAGALAAVYTISPSSSAAEEEIGARFSRQYTSDLQHMPTVIAYLREITDAIVERQRNNRESLDPAKGKLVALSMIDPDLVKKMPESLPRGTQFIVRADQKDLKVLANWTLCGVAMFSNPEMLDPVRSRTDSIGCPFFGMWTSGAVKW